MEHFGVSHWQNPPTAGKFPPRTEEGIGPHYLTYIPCVGGRYYRLSKNRNFKGFWALLQFTPITHTHTHWRSLSSQSADLCKRKLPFADSDHWHNYDNIAHLDWLSGALGYSLSYRLQFENMTMEFRSSFCRPKWKAIFMKTRQAILQAFW